MLWVRVTDPRYEQSERYVGEVGEVVGRWGPENSADGREGYLVEFGDGEIIGVTDDEIEVVRDPDVRSSRRRRSPSGEVWPRRSDAA